MPSTPSTTANAGELPWWAAPGSERCPVCLLTYHVESEYRCEACDGPLCPDCAVTRVTSVTVVQLFCADCEAGEEER